jgi:hypothetical protein
MDAVPHFSRSFVGERNGQNRRRRYPLIADEVRNPVRDYTRLAASGARQDQERTFGVRDRFALLWIQALEEIHEK